jgi:hypothetical protein
MFRVALLQDNYFPTSIHSVSHSTLCANSKIMLHISTDRKNAMRCIGRPTYSGLTNHKTMCLQVKASRVLAKEGGWGCHLKGMSVQLICQRVFCRPLSSWNTRYWNQWGFSWDLVCQQNWCSCLCQWSPAWTAEAATTIQPEGLKALPNPTHLESAKVQNMVHGWHMPGICISDTYASWIHMPDINLETIFKFN